MPSYLAVYEDSAPYFTYTGGWRAGTSSDDRSADRYSESSFTVTDSPGATFSFIFYGTAVSIHGAKRGNHGPYQVTVDGQLFPTESGQSTPDQFNVTLFSTILAKGQHTVQLQNSGRSFRDIDYVTWEASVGEPDEPLIVNTVQDNHPTFEYTPTTDWTTEPPLVGTYSGANGHATGTVGASAVLTFRGDAIALYGPSGPDCAATYSVQVDGRPSQSFSALKQFYRARQLLYYGANLGPGEHKLTVTLTSNSNPGQLLAIDYAEIYTAPSLGGSFAPLDGSTSLPIGLIAGLAVTSALAVVCLIFLIYLLVLCKKGRIRRCNDKDDMARGAVNIEGAATGTNFNPSLMPFEVEPLQVSQFRQAGSSTQGTSSLSSYPAQSQYPHYQTQTYPVSSSSNSTGPGGDLDDHLEF
ncbi:hypothetical protein CC1G_03384 [Coprinopsis cinerea okayama7|uniref:Transmembrane protein n=1 Tax=Coprinopsis cinerea (strain Okayama-7 / 130 / ATCC MYA-4618 / FGSC 9003) TaxID=240176 RepID=A8NR18_COPC7|nr:hypothetical protein CC1G_03384 [Coprinopsis cinerea okayama7\|eukprot:XP_001835602.2 hypothetical protein CC1G_03384 [Coprinopsis cinerea okayama7\